MKIDYEAYESYGEGDDRSVHRDVGVGALGRDEKWKNKGGPKSKKSNKGVSRKETHTIVTPENSLRAFLKKTEREMPVYSSWVASSLRSYPDLEPNDFGMNGDGVFSARHTISKITFPVDDSIQDEADRKRDALANLVVVLDDHIRIWKDYLKEKGIKINKLSEEELKRQISSSIEEMVGVE